jgi:hypothetical protein
MSDASLTVTEAAIIDLQKQRDAFMARAKNFDPAATSDREPGDVRLSTDAVNAICAPVRIEITFDDPINTRQQIEILQGALVEALVVTQDHQRGINRQRMDLRNVIKTAAEVLVYMRGKTPTGKKPIKPRSTS